MSANQKSAPPEEPNSPWVGLLKFLLLAMFVLVCYLLVQSMVRHHFFSGGYSQRQHQQH
jgi:hypothetical protein